MSWEKLQSVQDQETACAQPIITLRRVWNDYQLTRKLKPATLRNYNQRLNLYLHDWLDVPITTITKDMVEQRHAQIPGAAMANSTFRTLRALLHYAAVKYEDADGVPLLRANPVRRLSELRAWHRDKRRKSVIQPHQFNAWFRAVFSLDNTTTRDLLLLTMLTGMRRIEAMSLSWDCVDLNAGTITIDTKTMESVTLPLSEYAWEMLIIRKQRSNSRWVFPGRLKDSHISSGHKAVETVIKRSGVNFCLHDLRRTFITVADELEIKNEVIKQLVNHKLDDITEGYTCRAIERLRRATQQITDAILTHAGIKPIGLELISQHRKTLVAKRAQVKPPATTSPPKHNPLDDRILDAVYRLSDASVNAVYEYLCRGGRVRYRSVVDAMKRLSDNGKISAILGITIPLHVKRS